MDALRLLADPTRREILRLTWEHPMAAGEIASRFDTTFGAVSQHLGRLREAGYVHVTREGNRRIYTADREGLGPLRSLVEAMWSDRLDMLVAAAEDSL